MSAGGVWKFTSVAFELGKYTVPALSLYLADRISEELLVIHTPTLLIAVEPKN